jgi:creatinine amidohydrolase/Fe(II)-dependent formamide hydrolase-like protein
MKLRAVVLVAAPLFAQTVDMELLTYAEVGEAVRNGKTTVLIYNGGTEQRGPHAVLGGHTLIARRTGEAIARELGNALLAPVLPFSPAANHLNPKWPGTASISSDAYIKVNEEIVASMATAGFRHVVLMGDHGGAQKELEDLAAKLDAKYKPAARVHFCGAVYRAYSDFNAWLTTSHLPTGRHASVSDTSLLMYLGGEQFVRAGKLVAGDPTNGIDGDPRKSSAAIGKVLFDRKVAAGVSEIRKLTVGQPSRAADGLPAVLPGQEVRRRAGALPHREHSVRASV